MNVLYEIYVGDGWWSVLAWIGTVLLVGVIASFVVGALDARTPRIPKTRRTGKGRANG